MFFSALNTHNNGFVKPLQKNVRNTFVLKLHIFMLKVLGIYPSIKDSILVNIYASCLLGSGLCGIIFSAIHRFVVFPATDGIFLIEQFLASILIFGLWILFLVIFYSIWTKRISWKNFIQIICELDENISKSILRLHNYKWEVFKFIMKNLTLLVCLVINSFIRNIVGDEELVDLELRLSQNIGLFYDFQIAAFLWEISCIFQSRYTHIEVELQNVLTNKLMDHEISKHILEHAVHDIKYKYKLLYDAVREINIIFGWIILIIMFYGIEFFVQLKFMFI